MLEVAAENDEELLDLFVEDESVPEEMVYCVRLRKGTLSHVDCTPVLSGSALKHKGVRFVLDAVIDAAAELRLDDPRPIQGTDTRAASRGRGPAQGRTPSPSPSPLMAFKTIAEPTGDLTFVRVYSGVLEKGSPAAQPAHRQARSASVASIRRCTPTSAKMVDSDRPPATSPRSSA